MAEDLTISKGTKQEKYETLVPQIKALLEGETDLVANLANIAAAFKRAVWLVLGWILPGKRSTIGFGPVSGAGCLYAHPERTWRLRHFLGKSGNADCAGCGSISGPYCL